MTRKSVKGAAVVGMLLLVLTLATTTYAKLVVLSFGFDNSTQGFTASMASTSGCANSANTSWSSGMLQLTIDAACPSAPVVINKVVVLSSGLGSPAIDMRIRNDDGALDVDHVRATLSSISNPSAKLVVLGADEMAGGWYSIHGEWGSSASAGTANLQISIPLNAGVNNRHYAHVDDIELSDLAQ